MNRRSCNDRGVCQVEGALAFDKPCPQPCDDCDLHVAPIVVEGKTVAYEVGRRAEPAYAARFPFAPGVIEIHRPAPRGRSAFAVQFLGYCVVTVALFAAGGFLAGYLRGKGWL